MYVCTVGVLFTYETEEAYCGTDNAGQGVGKLAEELSFKCRVFRSRLRQETTHHRSLRKDQTVAYYYYQDTADAIGLFLMQCFCPFA